MSKRDDDASGTTNDLEAGMTTAERRRRRRRGGGLRVPSDNVPRRTNPPVVAPVPEDPSLAMSIAYSFSAESSEPMPRVTMETPVPRFDEPVAPEGASTMIDPPSSPSEPQDFEMKTREMAAVDLEALGLAMPGSERVLDRLGLDTRSSVPGNPLYRTQPGYAPGDLPPADAAATDPSMPRIAEAGASAEHGATAADATLDVDVDVDLESSSVGRIPDPSASDSAPELLADDLQDVESSAPAPASRAVRERKARLKTMALSDDDLEEVREAVRAAGNSQPMSKLAGLSQPGAPGVAPTRQPSALAALQAQVTQPMAPIREAEDDSAAAQMWGARPATIPPPVVPDRAPSTPTQPPATAQQAPLPRAPLPASTEPLSVPEIDIRELGERSDEYEVDVDVDDRVVEAPPSAPTPAPQAPPQVPMAPIVAQPPRTPPEATRTRAPSVPPPLAPPPTASQPPPPPAAAHKAPPAPPPAAKKPEKPAATAAPKVEGKGARTKAWFAEIFDEDYLRTLPFLTPQATQAEAEFVIDALTLQPGAQVLDIGCGYGRHAMELAARGFHVVGLDLSTPLLMRGGEEAHRRGLEINFIRGDMRELDFDSQFDAAYCLFSTFGYFDDETNKRTISNVARALKPGGRLMLEILNRDYVIADLPTRVWWEGEGCVVLEEVELNYFSSRIQVNRSVVFDDGRQLEQEISVRAYSLHEVGKLMHAAGFRVLEVSGGYQTRGRFFGNQSRHIIVVAERKDGPAS